MLWKEKFQSYKLYARPEAKISPRVMIPVVSQYVIGFTCHNESMLIGLFRQRQFADERKWLFVSADVSGTGTCDEPLRTSAWEAIWRLTDTRSQMMATKRLPKTAFLSKTVTICF